MWEAGVSPSDEKPVLLFHLACLIFAQDSWGVIVIALALRKSSTGSKAYRWVKNIMPNRGLDATLCNFKG